MKIASQTTSENTVSHCHRGGGSRKPTPTEMQH